jgi:hypothetical protein
MHFKLASAIGLLIAALACTDISRSPVGEELLPQGVLDGELEVVVVTDWDLAVDYPIFPSERGESDRLVSAFEWSEVPGFESRPIFRFSLAALDSLPTESVFLSANLKLVFAPAPAAPVSFHVHRVTSEWDEATADWDRRDLGVDWSTPGGDVDPEPLIEFTIEGGEVDTDSVSVPLPPSLIEDWVSGVVANEGLLLIQQTPGSAVQFVSRGFGGSNPLGPRLEVETQLGEPGSPVGLSVFPAVEDNFLPVDRDPFESGGLTVGAGEPVSRAVLIPNFDQVPAGAAIVDVKLIVSVERARIPGDSLRFLANQVLSEFLGEKTILARATGNSILGLTTVSRDSLPVDSLVFESSRLRDLVRLWLRDPETNRGIAINVLDESTGFGGVTVFDPSSPVELRPRLRLVVLPESDQGDAP